MEARSSLYPLNKDRRNIKLYPYLKKHTHYIWLSWSSRYFLVGDISDFEDFSLVFPCKHWLLHRMWKTEHKTDTPTYSRYCTKLAPKRAKINDKSKWKNTGNNKGNFLSWIWRWMEENIFTLRICNHKLVLMKFLLQIHMTSMAH